LQLDSVAARTNCAFLLASFLVIKHGYSAEKAWGPFERVNNAFAEFRDASSGRRLYSLPIISCLNGLAKAISLGWYSHESFDVDLYDWMDDPKVADLHAISPKFIAFKGPGAGMPTDKKTRTFPPQHFVPFFKQQRVTSVVRLNEHSSYDPKIFTEAGISHHDLYFDDCTVPSHATLLEFFRIANDNSQVAVHCRVRIYCFALKGACRVRRTYYVLASQAYM
jgi:cell division cycle 14